MQDRQGSTAVADIVEIEVLKEIVWKHDDSFSFDLEQADVERLTEQLSSDSAWNGSESNSMSSASRPSNSNSSSSQLVGRVQA